MKTKVCTKCKIEKSVNEFNKDRYKKDELCCSCKACQLRHRKKNRHIWKNYYKKNKHTIIKRVKKWYLKTWKARKQYREKNKKKRLQKQRKHYQENKEQLQEYHRNYMNNRNKTDVRFRLAGNLRHRIYESIKNNYQSFATMMLIGCEIDYLMYHIQKQFKKDMNWDNYGEWHIDHIKPCASFDLSKPEEQRKCFHYTNLQPLWKLDNLKKGNRDAICM